MSERLCFETICVQNRQLINISYHENRLNKTRRELYSFDDLWNLRELITIPDFITELPHKCRLSYGKGIDQIKWEPYQLRSLRKIQKVYDDSIDYAFKYNDRSKLNALFEQKKDADDILIIKNGMVTDTNYCNVAFHRDDKWFTPDTPLLPGTQRAFLLDSGRIEEADISENDITKFSHIRLFNAMVSWENSPVLEIQCIQS
jgi:4-amino-4-deoxychorismate lyase